jgi:hypothetical protein
MERVIVQRIDEVASLTQVMHALHTAFADQRFDPDNVARFLDELVELGMVLKEQVPAGTHYLGLALMPQRLRPALEASSRRRLQLPLAGAAVPAPAPMPGPGPAPPPPPSPATSPSALAATVVHV